MKIGFAEHGISHRTLFKKHDGNGKFVIMPVVRLVCWNQDLGQQRAGALASAGFQVNAEPLQPGRLMGQFRAQPAAAVLIDLDRLPSHGREVAVALRGGKTTRTIPIVFAGGVAEKVQRIRQELPDAVFTDWKKVVPVLTRVLTKTASGPKTPPIQPISHMGRYAGSSLVKKLGLAPNMGVAMLGAPDGFETTLEDWPEGAHTEPKIGGQTKIVLWFVRSRRELDSDVQYLSARVPEGCPLWIIHPKKAGRYRVDFNQNDVRAAALNAGLVDYKVCSVDADWSGLKFARSKR